MDTLGAMAVYNRWATRKVFARCLELEPAILESEAPGTNGSIEKTLKHMVLTEDGFLNFTRGSDPLRGHSDPRAYIRAFMAHDLAWFAGFAEELADGFDAMIASADDAFLEGEFRVPWFDFAWKRREGILQAFLHSTVHRSQVFAALGARGLDVPDLDYPRMLLERQAAT
jgi:uncharacterized damage-inducible protein DinB